jgi:serine phosphatase RsbU (regulator of sigma subunit)
MTDVAGDFFDFATIDNNRVGILVADVSGHGVPAALVAAMVKVAFQAQAGHCDGPARVLSGMNEMLGHRLEEQFVTAGYACVDTLAGSIDYAGAGHPPLLIKFGSGEIEDLPASGLMLGPFPDAQYESTGRRLAPGDRIMMYTDGVVEAFNTKDEEFGERRLRDLLSAGASLSVEEFADRVLDEVKRWTGIGRNDSLDDDLTVIVIDLLAHQET